MANDYVTIAEIKAGMPNFIWDTTYDTLLTSLATRASRAIDKYCNRKPGTFYVSADSTLYFDAPRGGISSLQSMNENRLGAGGLGVGLWVGELAAAPTSVSISTNGSVTSYTALASTDYILWPFNALDDGHPYQRLDLDLMNGQYMSWYGFKKGVKVVGKFGYSTTVPDDVKQAVMIMAARWFKRSQLNYQDLGVVTDSAQMVYQNKIDSDVETMLQHYRRQAI